MPAHAKSELYFNKVEVGMTLPKLGYRPPISVAMELILNGKRLEVGKRQIQNTLPKVWPDLPVMPRPNSSAKM